MKGKKKLNCWELKQCGRQPGGEKEGEICPCPAGEPSIVYDRHDGIFAGRCCWRVAGTLCEGEVQGVYAKKIKDCRECDFYKMVKDEEGENFVE